MRAAGPVWIEEFEIRVLHERLLALHGGRAGLQDEALLMSAVARPRQLALYEDDADVVRLAGAYAVGIIKTIPVSTETNASASSSACCFSS